MSDGYIFSDFTSYILGSIVLFNVKLGGGPYSQTLELSWRAYFLDCCLYFYETSIDSYCYRSWYCVRFILGAWSGESIKSIDLMGVSRTMPISTGLQLVATTLFGVIVFHEWSTTISVVLGVLALVCIIIGVILTSLQSEEEKNAEQAGNFKRGIIILLISTVGYLVYVVVIRLFKVDGWSALLPQAVGMVLGGFCLRLNIIHLINMQYEILFQD